MIALLAVAWLGMLWFWFVWVPRDLARLDATVEKKSGKGLSFFGWDYW